MALLDAPVPGEGELSVELMRGAGLSVHPGWFYDLDSRGVLVLSLLGEPDSFAEHLRRFRSWFDSR
jgi:hypothetical protein